MYKQKDNVRFLIRNNTSEKIVRQYFLVLKGKKLPPKILQLSEISLRSESKKKKRQTKQGYNTHCQMPR